MSGIFGVVNSRRDTSIPELLHRMGSEMSHREWYVVETYSEAEAGMGLGRIGIGIFNQEEQPRCNEDQSLMVFLAGEFYKTGDTRRVLEKKGHHFRDDSDLELALRLYEEKGARFIHDLEGAFVLAIWNRPRRQLLVANDRFGLYPLYYAHYDGKLVFAPEMKGILCDSGFHKELDMTALAEYMRFQFLLGDKTFFEGLKLLPNASLLRHSAQTNRMTLQPYWDFSEIRERPDTLTFEDAVEETSRLLRGAVNRSTAGDYRLGVYLSGGMDSRVVLGLIDKSEFPITTVTYGQQDCRDVVYAREIAAKVGTEHHYFEFPNGKWVEEFADLHLELTEGFHSWIHAHGISVLQRVRSLIDVDLTGFGGGQTAIDWEDPALLHAEDDIAFTSRLFSLLSQETTWPSLRNVEEKFLFAARISSQMRGLAFDSFRRELARYDHLPYQQRAAYFALCNPDRRLFQYYTVFKRSYLEQRLPFYDYRYLEFVYALPPEMLFDRRLRRATILRTMRPLARIPYDKDNLPITDGRVSYMSAKLIQKGKSFANHYIAPVFPEYPTLYADYENWLRNELREWGKEILLGDRTLQRDIFNPECLRSLWRRHQSGLEVHMIGKIAPIMTYEMMLRRCWD
ncbi:MAG: asparagine synthetase B family protein [bacterium]